MISSLASDEGEVMLVKKWINEKKEKHQSPGLVALPDFSFYHVNKANGTVWGGQFPSRHFGQMQLSCVFRPTMRNVFGGLSFNLTTVAAERAPGTSSHDCCNHSGARTGNLNLAPYISVWKITSTTLSLCAWLSTTGLRVAADCCTCSVTPLWFPGEETRFMLPSNIWFITIWNSTSVRLLCLKNSSQRPKEQGGKIHQRGTALKLTAVIVLCHLVHLPWNRKGLIFYDVW